MPELARQIDLARPLFTSTAQRNLQLEIIMNACRGFSVIFSAGRFRRRMIAGVEFVQLLPHGRTLAPGKAPRQAGSPLGQNPGCHILANEELTSPNHLNENYSIVQTIHLDAVRMMLPEAMSPTPPLPALRPLLALDQPAPA